MCSGGCSSGGMVDFGLFSLRSCCPESARSDLSYILRHDPGTHLYDFVCRDYRTCVQSGCVFPLCGVIVMSRHLKDNISRSTNIE